MIPRRWSNCSHNKGFHSDSHDSVSRQTHFSFRGHHLTCLLTCLAVPDYFLWGYIKSKVYETHPANIDDLKWQIWECVQGISKEMQCFVTAFPLQLQ
jgi:hypothetical protein